MGRLRTRVTQRVRRMLDRTGAVDVESYRVLLPRIAAREDNLRELAEEELTAAAAKLAAAADGTFTADQLVELCALGREAAGRALGERPYDVQLLGTMVMLDGHVAEMATGEGKTLSGALAAAGYALRARDVQVLSVNDYLARRDACWMSPVYALLGLSARWIAQDSSAEERRGAYRADVTYVPVSEAGFDVLRDRLATDPADLVVPGQDVTLVDEADSVLVDEARVPLVLAGAADRGTTDEGMAAIVRSLRARRDYEVDDDRRTANLTAAGTRAVEEALGGVDLYAPDQLQTLASVQAALHARVLVTRDVDYVVRDGRVQLVDDSRGRVARLQRWPDGLQAAVEAKEGLAASETGEILDTLTVQALVRKYAMVCGMTGTAMAAAEQFREFYSLEVAVIPPNRPCVRSDEPDRLYDTVGHKEAAAVAEIKAAHERGQPVLIGTLDVAESERIAGKLDDAGVSCVVLNAKNDAQEAAVIAEAGTYGAVTCSTQMAGRGTDIRLGGASGSDHDRVVATGGLYVVATGRHRSSRMDAQLRGRAGRQGDPGRSVTFASLEDELVARNVPYAEPASEPGPDGRVDDRQVRHVMEHAQRVAEGVDLEIHQNTWRYNRLVEGQREAMAVRRNQLLHTDAAAATVEERRPERYAELRAAVGEVELLRACRLVALYHLDRSWVHHLEFLTDLRDGIHLQALGRQSPLDAFNRQAIEAFESGLADVDTETANAFDALRVDGDRIDVEAAGLKRPTATWTYVVKDNPFGSQGDRVSAWVGSKILRRR